MTVEMSFVVTATSAGSRAVEGAEGPAAAAAAVTAQCVDPATGQVLAQVQFLTDMAACPKIGEEYRVTLEKKIVDIAVVRGIR